MTTEEITIEQFDEIYKPLVDEDGSELMFMKWYKAYEYVEKHFPNEPLPYRHIWSANDYGDRYYVMYNGYHPVNNLHYTVCEIPWGTDSDEDNGKVSIIADNNNYD